MTTLKMMFFVVLLLVASVTIGAGLFIATEFANVRSSP